MSKKSVWIPPYHQKIDSKIFKLFTIYCILKRTTPKRTVEELINRELANFEFDLSLIEKNITREWRVGKAREAMIELGLMPPRRGNKYGPRKPKPVTSMDIETFNKYRSIYRELKSGSSMRTVSDELGVSRNTVKKVRDRFINGHCIFIDFSRMQPQE